MFTASAQSRLPDAPLWALGTDDHLAARWLAGLPTDHPLRRYAADIDSITEDT